MLSVGIILCAIILLFMSIFGLSGPSSINDSPAFNAIFVYAYLLFYGITIGPIVWFYNAEIIPEKGVSIATAANWIMASLVVISYSILSTPNLYNYPLLFYGIMCLVGFIIIRKELVETSGHSPAQIDQLFKE